MRSMKLFNFEDEVRLMKNYSLLCFNTDYIYYEKSRYGKNINQFLILKNNETNELFKFDIAASQYYYYSQMVSNMKKTIVDFNCYHHIYNKLSQIADKELRPVIFKYYDPENLSNGTAVKTFCSKIINKACGKIELSTGYSILIKDMLYSTDPVYFDDFYNYNKNANNIIVDQYKEKIEALLKDTKYFKYFGALYLMYLKDSPFSGNYKIEKEKFSTNTKADTFDIVRLSFTMSPNRKKVIDYVKNDKKFLENIVRPIFNYNLGKYANFMKVYNLVLTNTNELVFSFCFKEKAEKLLSGESK